ncbi:acetyl-CoA carboxylase biotin carboxylase subunit [Gluconobacter thailandicus F149-1 = NBRC 100600]|uniref:Biotin carboxylase n=1 Tax=Gluconobacter thailandicus NBRC 3257 TaxID=1381097 RepID=A0ABQ0ISY0_GLUTH|nr:acetyl-CoA carboxylase biotin carboxylase subunit [Gluconobacter thailandicus]AFW02593.1 biotin carboxylase (acetyl-CoA carboxylase subunit A) [Gluconobacter oxydans H24]ANQ41922.1 acetyl-CoA carboxylase biotin carboxylase subunit [Gluconobacter oxydans]KXV55086.1 acetyl-CoA carboxylase [Gluconobacter thailandicus]GAD25318.1 acetyl-CoA carboxylase biotin carboxylase subunit [Gluconobacter thailandicus NBRC 3257]GAN93241.1 acetyl-CoA carboxylase biotin carboxylase subunit [Gluconobacter thai
MREIRRVLIANRGEIALRIVRACRLLGLETVGICSEADSSLAHLRLVDEVLCIGPASPGQSYLDGQRILHAAALSGADAIHPGYGFLSENADFAEAVEKAGLILVGPGADIMRLMGDKISAKRQMRLSDVPCLPGSDDALPTGPEAAQSLCDGIGYPLIVKASGGGGGRGMRVVWKGEDLLTAIETAREEAGRAFGNPAVYAERFLQKPRHIEIQVLADTHGQAIWLGARDCSVQRRHQKLIEEAPAAGIPAEQIAALGERCARACEQMGYVGAGTFEFLYEDGEFAFIEMNTRLQVEHPVTEMTTGIDIVQEQLRIAMGRPLSICQSDIRTDGHAIECRINAENPETFRPAPGRIGQYRAPGGPGVRVDTHLYDGYTVPPNYDSLIAKLIVHGADRADAIRRMKAALDELEITGIETTTSLHRRLMDEPGFSSGDISVHYLESLLKQKDAP